MKAGKNRKYARISKENKVDKIFTIKEMEEWCQCGTDNKDISGNPHPYCIFVIDITGYDIKIGDTYNYENKTFTRKTLKTIKD